MSHRLSHIIRSAIHAPRRFMYAFMWAAVPPEDELVRPATPNPVSPTTS